MKRKQIMALVMSVLMCFSSFSIPTFAVLPDTLTERTNEYTVTINLGDGIIKTNTDETVKSNKKLGREYTYIDANPEDFIDISNIELTVREEETIKNRLDYSTTHAVDVGFVTYSDIYEWSNEAFITSTRVANSVLCQGLNTDFSFSDESLSSELRGVIYPQNVTKAYLFIPDNRSMIFSHFVDQDGNPFNLNEPVTRDLILTPIYTDKITAEDDNFFGNKVHQVTILPGAGKIQEFIGDDKYLFSSSEDANDKDFKDLDNLTFVVKDGDTEFFDITTPYARLIYGDLELSENFLQDGYLKFDKYIDTSTDKEFIEEFVKLVENSNTIWFTDGGIVNQMFSGEALRENGYSLLFLLSSWAVIYGKDETSSENLSDILSKFEKYDELSETEKAELKKKTKDTLNAFKSEWDSFVNSEIMNCGTNYLFVSDVKYKGYISNSHIYGDRHADKCIRLRTPISNHYYYVFSHFVDQDGNIFNFGDPVTKDLVLTPIYYDEWDPRAVTSVVGQVSVTTEDNSDEAFNLSINREYINSFHSIKNYNNNSIEKSLLLSAFSEDELNGEIEKDEFIRRFSEYSISEDDIIVDENGYVQEYLLPIYQYLQNKASYSFNPDDWEINSNGIITKYNGEFGLIGIPENINGIEVTSIATSTFANLYNKFLDSYEGYNSEAAVSYYENNCAIWIPSTITQLNNGIGDYALEAFISSALQGAESDEDKDYILNLSQFFNVSYEGIDDCTPFVYLPHSYIVVDSDNPNYASLGGSLYNKRLSELYYMSFTTSDAASYIINTEQGIELPSSIHTVSAFANYSPYYNSFDGFFHFNGQDITFNSYCSSITLDMLSMYEHYYEIGIQQGMSEDELAAYLEDTVGTASRDEATEMSNSKLDDLANANFFACAHYLSIITSSSNKAAVTESIRVSLTDFLGTAYPDMREEDISEQVEEIINMFVMEDNLITGKINKTGTVSNSKDYNTTFLKWDEYAYSVSLENIPNRYKSVNTQTLIPSNESRRQVTFNLELKKGNVRVVSKSLKDTSLFLNSTYQIIDRNGDVIANISSLSDGTKAALNDLPYGEYTIVQTKVENGYALATSQTFSITEDGQLIELEFLNDKSSIYSVKVPKKIILNGSDGTADITVSVRGNISPTGKISVIPAAPLILYEQASIDKKNNVISSISITQSVWTSDNISLNKWSDAVWHISAPITAGIWQGRIPIIIKIESTE